MSAPLPRELHRVDPKEAWQQWSASATQLFDAQWAAHLLRRAAFGASPNDVQRVVRDGIDATIQRLFVGDEHAPSRLTFLDDVGEQIARTGAPEKLRAWWLYAMRNGGHPQRDIGTRRQLHVPIPSQLLPCRRPCASHNGALEGRARSTYLRRPNP
jgi:hypothetical protein